MQTSLVNVALFSFMQLLLSLTCFHEGVGAASGKGEFICLPLDRKWRNY